MKILHVLEAMGGGTRRHVLDLLPALAARGHAVSFAVSTHRNWPEPETFRRDREFLESRGVRVRCIEMPRGLGGIAAPRELAALIRAEKFDIIHAHSSVAGALARLAKIGARSQTPLVYTPHCIAFETGLPHSQRRAARHIEQLLAPLCTRYIAVSQHEARAIKRVLRRDATVIPNGIDLPDFDAVAPQNRADWNLLEKDFVIGCFGRLCAQKNQMSLLHAFETVSAQLPHAKLLFVGDGEDRAMLEEYGRNRPYSARIIFAGEHAEARGFYVLCDVVAQPSRWEGCPYAILETMAARKTVVAKAVGGVPEIVARGGGIAYRNERDLAASILAAHHENRDGEVARARIETAFTLQQMVDKTVAVYESAK